MASRLVLKPIYKEIPFLLKQKMTPHKHYHTDCFSAHTNG